MRDSRTILVLLFGLLVVVCATYLTVGARGNWDFVIPFRGARLLALLTIAVAVATSTLVFQTISGNRILTPSIMGFDALYLFLQTGLVFLLGGLGYAGLNDYAKFGIETVVMMVAALALFGAVLRNASDLGRMILTGLILGVLLRSLTSLIERIMDPSQFAVVQSASFAQFSSLKIELSGIAMTVTFGVFLWLMFNHRKLDVIALGRDSARGLGLDHDRETRKLLAAVALLVSISTALVGPVVFFGLLTSALAHAIGRTWRHIVLLPATALIAAIVLVGSQTLFERVLKLQTSVSVVIEALGGIVFLFLVLRRRPT